MGLRTVSIESLPDAFREEVNHLIREAIRDCADRPQYGKSRTINVQLAITPEDTRQPICKGVTIDPQVKLTLPASAATPINAMIRSPKDAHAGNALFNDLSVDNARQQTMDEPPPVDPKTGEVIP